MKNENNKIFISRISYILHLEIIWLDSLYIHLSLYKNGKQSLEKKKVDKIAQRHVLLNNKLLLNFMFKKRQL